MDACFSSVAPGLVSLVTTFDGVVVDVDDVYVNVTHSVFEIMLVWI